MSEADGERPLIAFAAPAKVNLYLHVTGRRPDGLHELDSLFVRVDAADRLSGEPAGGLSLDVRGPFAGALPTHERDDNLVLKAARLLAAKTGVTSGASLVLEKHLPVAAGIGGGSADAAAALGLLRQLWSLDIETACLADIAARLGADVPACLHREPLAVSGTGEAFQPAPRLPAAWLVLVNPGVELLTADVFAARTGGFGAPQPVVRRPADIGDLARELGFRRNDLEPAAIALAPVIADVLGDLAARPEILLARMSGSGATCFGLTASRDDADQAAASLLRAHPDWWVRAVAMLQG